MKGILIETEYQGEMYTLNELSEVVGISKKTLYTRYCAGERGEELCRKFNLFKCKICGKDFKTTYNHTKCCSEECRKENAKINSKHWADKQKQIKPKKKEKKLTVTDIAVKAREAGMSYGQYTAMMYMQERKV
jgi:hypothetical protein